MKLIQQYLKKIRLMILNSKLEQEATNEKCRNIARLLSIPPESVSIKWHSSGK
jgi:hypothetical protein